MIKIEESKKISNYLYLIIFIFKILGTLEERSKIILNDNIATFFNIFSVVWCNRLDRKAKTSISLIFTALSELYLFSHCENKNYCVILLKELFTNIK